MINSILQTLLRFCKTRLFKTVPVIFFKKHYNLLLLSLVLLFIFRPYNDSFLYLAVWKALLTGTALVVIFSKNRSPRSQFVEVLFGVPTVLFCWLDFLFFHPVIFITNIVFSILFTLICTTTIIYDVLTRVKVNLETLKGVICAYFFVAIGFAYLFWLIEYIKPGSFLLSTVHKELFYYTQYLSEMIYFSFVTLLTIGYGDIVAVKDLGQTAVILEGIVGQFYVAILVARLVSAYSFYERRKMTESQKNPSGDRK